MNSAYEQQQKLDDEISLVDLAAVFVRRRLVFYIVFVVVTLAGLAYALLSSDKYEYISLIEMAEKGSGASIEKPPTVIATMESRWLPEVSARYRSENEEKLPFDVNASNPEQTSLVRLASETEQENADLAGNIHKALIEAVKQHQDGLLKAEEKNLQRQIESLNNIIQALEGQQDAGEALASAIEKRVRLESELEQLTPVGVLVVSRESADEVGPKRWLIVALTVSLGLMLGICAALLFEFGARVKRQVASADYK